MFRIKVVEPCWRLESRYKDEDIDFLLEEDKWNDHNFFTTYQLFAGKRRVHEGEEMLYLGTIKIMKSGQQRYDAYLLRQELRDKGITDFCFSELPQDYCSLSYSDTLYNFLTGRFTPEEIEEFIHTFHLILCKGDEYYEMVAGEACFINSLLRDTDMTDAALWYGYEALRGGGAPYDLRKQKLTIQYVYSDAPLSLSFSSIQYGGIPLKGMNGVVAFIGKNGSGKSTALYKLATLLYTAASMRVKYKDSIGKITPTGLGITQLFIFSYNPFDTFKLPGYKVKEDLRRMVEEHGVCHGKLIYCGLRDVQKEALRELNEREKKERKSQELLDESQETAFEHMEEACLKNPFELAKESWEAYQTILSAEENSWLSDFWRREAWAAICESMQGEQPELYEIAQKLQDVGNKERWLSTFHHLSTGHKFFFHSMLHIVAYCKKNALLLFDEPENHLQAPLLSFMLATVRRLLEARSSVMLIATHSPVVLQEIPAQNVRVVRRSGHEVRFGLPRIETFAENHEAIVSEVFDLTSDKVQYYHRLDELFEKVNKQGECSLRELLEKVEYFMGGLSSPAMLYLAQKYTERRALHVAP